MTPKIKEFIHFVEICVAVGIAYHFWDINPKIVMCFVMGLLVENLIKEDKQK